jgi:hypothetical protein
MAYARAHARIEGYRPAARSLRALATLISCGDGAVDVISEVLSQSNEGHQVINVTV